MQHPRQTIWRCLAVVSLSLAFGLVAIAFGARPATATSAGFVDHPVPDVALIATEVDGEIVAELVARLEAIDGVARATSDAVSEDEVVFYLVRSDLDGRPLDVLLSEAEQTIRVAAPQSLVLTGGTAAVDKALAGQFRSTAVAVVVLATLIGLLLSLAFGLQRGVVAAVALAFTVGCGAAIGNQVGGQFDGTLSTTSVPGAMAALAISAVVAVRLLVWFRAPFGADGAQRIRNAASDMAAEFALVLTGLAVAALLVELLDPGRSPLTVICISAMVSAVVMTTVLATALAVLPPRSVDAPLYVPVSLPDGRDVPLLVAAAVVVGLAVLSVFALRQPTVSLLDVGRLAEGDEAALVASKLAVGGGDATTAVLAYKPDDVDRATFERWAAAVVERPEVESVDLASGRLRSTGPVEVGETTLLVPPVSLTGGSSVSASAGANSPDTGIAVVVLNVSPRSEAGQQAVGLLGSSSLLGAGPALGGYGVDSFERAGSRVTVVVAVVVLAVVAGLAMQVLAQSRSRAAVAFVLRLLGGGATVGIYRLMAPGATVAETLTVLGLVALGAGLLQLEFVALGRHGYQPRSADVASPAVYPAMYRAKYGAVADAAPVQTTTDSTVAGTGPNPGQYAAFGLASLALLGFAVSITGLFGGAPDTGRLSLGLLAVVVVEVLTGTLMLTPALLGQRGVFHTVARPVRIALHSATERPADELTNQADPTWRRIVEDLIQAEFRLQSEPVDAPLDSVFVADTPLYRQAATHHENLGRADLRIVGRRPRLRSIKSVGGRSPVSLAITVDHPERQLVARDGTVVGVRKPERRSGVLWLSEAVDGTFRIAESVELGSVPLLPEDEVGGPDLGAGLDPGADSGRVQEIRLDDEPDVTGRYSTPQSPPSL